MLGFEQLADEAATISEHGDAPAAIERAGSTLRALWIVDVPSRGGGRAREERAVVCTTHLCRADRTPCTRSTLLERSHLGLESDRSLR